MIKAKSNTVDDAVIVRCRGISKRYSENADFALNESDLDIYEGEFFSLLGPSGSGKTTMLRLIAGFEVPTSGCVFLSDVDVTREPANKRQLNTVFQNYALFPHLTIQQNVEYPLSVSGTDSSQIQQRVGEVLEMVEMTGFEACLPHELSGGQRQRIALARALVARPKVLLLDEPLGALDLRLRQQMQLVLVHLQREVGITFIYVTHDQGEALSMSDRMAVLNQGRLLQIDHPKDIYKSPKSRFVASFIGTCNIFEGSIDAASNQFLSKDGTFSIKLPNPEEGGEAALAVRAESLVVKLASGGTGEASGSILRGAITDTLYFGDSMEIRIGVRDFMLKAVVHESAGYGFKNGDEVDVLIDPSSVVVLRE